MNCKNCGYEIPENSKFCLECGLEVVEEIGPVDIKPKINMQSQSYEINKYKQKKSKLIPIILTSSIVIVILLVVIFLGLKNKTAIFGIVIPDIKGVEESTANAVLLEKGLIPSYKYKYDDSISSGYVIESYPAIGSKIDKDSSITIYVSKGPIRVESKDSNMTVGNISSGHDEWNFNAPYIYEDSLIIECVRLKFATNFDWRDPNNRGYGFGTASINDTFNKTVPVKANYITKSVKKNVEHYVALEIPLADLEVKKPTNLFIKLNITVDGVNKEILLEFTITW